MRISDWSSDVCSSDLEGVGVTVDDVPHRVVLEGRGEDLVDSPGAPVADDDGVDGASVAGEEEAVVVPPRQAPELAGAKREERRHTGERGERQSGRGA